MHDADLVAGLFNDDCIHIINKYYKKMDNEIYDDNLLSSSNFCKNLRDVSGLSEELCDEVNVNFTMEQGNENCCNTKSEESIFTNESSINEAQKIDETKSYNLHVGSDKVLEEEKDHLETSPKNGFTRKHSKKKTFLSGGGRGCPKKTQIAIYHSQISGDKNGIKIRIKKSNFAAQLVPNKKSGRNRKHKITSVIDPSDNERRSKRSRINMDDDVTSTQDDEVLIQSAWGDSARLPADILQRIFFNVVLQEGCLPFLVKISKVCRFWRQISEIPTLWFKADLNYVKENYRTDLRLHWLILNRLVKCQDLNMGEWKIRNIQTFLEALCEHCKDLRGLNLSGWKGFTPDHLKYLTTECKTLERLDLTSVNSTSAINAQPLVNLSQTMSSRLTHLVLAHNKIANFTQIMTAISTNCPNLQLLDISNVSTFAHNMSLLHIEKVQTGCPKLKVLRITNSQIWMAPASLSEQVASPGFPKLEELSLAGLEEDQTTTSRSVDDDCIERLLKCSTNLRLLDVRGCSKLSDSGLVRVPAWDLEHLFLSACYITRLHNSGLELIVQKWSHSLLEVDLAWSTATAPLDAAVLALAEKGPESKLRILNLCGSSVSLEPIKAVLTKCSQLHSINLQSCRALPRGIKRLYTGDQVDELRKTLNRAKTEASLSENGQSPDTCIT